MLMAASPPALLVQPPRVAMLFELRDSVVRDGVTLVLGQSFFQTAHDLSGASKREATSVKAYLRPDAGGIVDVRTFHGEGDLG
jgi:hypothetical protein